MPKLEVKKETMFLVPELDVRSMNITVDADGDVNDADCADKSILWTINYDRFNREFRDQVRGATSPDAVVGLIT